MSESRTTHSSTGEIQSLWSLWSQWLKAFTTPSGMERDTGTGAPRQSNSDLERRFGTLEPTATASSSSKSSPQRVTLTTITDTDFIILVLGPAGVGKTTFINSLADGQVTGLAVGHDLGARTTEVSCIRLPNIGRSRRQGSVVLVDTPGFDNNKLSDSAILEHIASWLEKLYRSGKLLSGVIYLERVTDIRFTNGSSRSINIFRRCYGRLGHNHLALVTTHWNEARGDDVDLSRANEQETFLVSEPWAFFLKKPNSAYVGRFDVTTPASAQADATRVVEQLIQAPSHENRLKLQIQWEMVDQGISLPRTQAGKLAFDKKETVEYYLRKFLKGDARD